jgi:hypothetical protein
MDVLVGVPRRHGYRKVSTLADFVSSLLRIVWVSFEEERMFSTRNPSGVVKEGP